MKAHERAKNSSKCSAEVPGMRQLPLTLTTLALLAAPAVAQSAFINLGTLETNVFPNRVSPDGSVVVGFTDSKAFRWSGLGAIQDLGTLAGGTFAVAYDASSNGTTITGHSSSASGIRAYRWQGNALGGFMTDLGVLPGGTISEGTAVSADGQTIAGYSNPGAGANHAMRWTSASGMVDLGVLPGGTFSVARSMSADGNTIAGFADSGGVQRAFVWTQPGGMQDIGTLSAGQPSTAWDVSADGSTIVGTSNFTAFVWDAANGIQSLGVLPGSSSSEARGVNGDGTLIVGGSSNKAFVWSQATGMVNLQTHLQSMGVSLTGWTLRTAYGISDDGAVIAGQGTFNGAQRGWIVTNFSLTAPPTPCPGDVNGDQQVDLGDLNEVLFNFGNVCP